MGELSLTPRPNTNGQLISFDPAKCNSDPLVIDTNPLCKPDCSIDPVKNRNFKSDGLGVLTVIDWDLPGLFAANVTSNDPTTVGAATPLQTTIALRQTYNNIEPGVYRVYYNVTSSKPDWGLGIQVKGETPVTIFVNELDLTVNGYFDFPYSGLPGTNELVVFFVGLDDTFEFIPHFLNICPVPAFDAIKRYCFQLPMYAVTGDNLINEILGMVQYHTDVHSGTLDFTDTITPFVPNTIWVQNWDFPFVDYPIGYDGALFFKWAVGDASVSWGTSYDLTPKAANLIFENSVGGVCLTGFSHSDEINPTISLADCFKSDLNVGDPVTVDDGAICVSGFYEEDTSSNPSDARVDVHFEDITNELYLMNNVIASFMSDDNTFYRFRFQLNNTTNVTIVFEDSAGSPFFVDIATGATYDAIINTGLLPVDKTITIRIEYGDVIACESDTFYVDMLTNASLEEYENWEVAVETCEPCDATFIDFVTGSQASVGVVEGDNYNLNTQFCVRIEDLEPGCYQVRIVGNSITDSINANYASQCFKVCDGTFDLCYFEFEFKGIICTGSNFIDFVNYQTSGKQSNQPHLWLRCDLQELTIDDERSVYRRSDGYSIVSYVQQFATYTLQLWSMPEYVRRAFAVGLINTFKINGVSYQKLDDEQIAPQFSFNPNSAIRFNVRRVGDFALSQNVLTC